MRKILRFVKFKFLHHTDNGNPVEFYLMDKGICWSVKTWTDRHSQGHSWYRRCSLPGSRFPRYRLWGRRRWWGMRSLQDTAYRK